jgi:hypothetical protein
MKAVACFEFDRRDGDEDENDLARFGYFVELTLKDLDKAKEFIGRIVESLRIFVSHD